MDNEIQLITDGDGLAIIGESAAVERFLVSEGVTQSRELDMHKLGTILRGGSGLADVASVIAANSGRWVKLTEQSAKIYKSSKMMKGSVDGVTRAIAMSGGKTSNILEIVTSASLLTSPVFLAAAGGMMSQMAMQQSMDEITDYLAIIDEKVNDVLRAQKDAVLSEMIGVDFVIEEAMTIRQQVGRVSEVTWSKVQGTALTIARTQAYTLRQLDALAGKLERKASMDQLAKTSKEAESTVQEWLAVLARCFQLQDAIAILEIDRVLNASPDELDDHRLALRSARQNRLELIARSTERLMARMDAAAGTANSKVLLHPIDSRAVVTSSNQVSSGVVEFHQRLGIDRYRDSVEAKRWLEAVTDIRDDVIESGSEGVDAAVRLGTDTFIKARSMTDKIAIKLAEQAYRRRERQNEIEMAADEAQEE